jgi:hypothetical protein
MTKEGSKSKTRKDGNELPPENTKCTKHSSSDGPSFTPPHRDSLAPILLRKTFVSTLRLGLLAPPLKISAK